MNLFRVANACLLAFAPLAASAEGFYIGLSAGPNWASSPFEIQAIANKFSNFPGLDLSIRPAGHVNEALGFAVAGSLGYAFDNSIRLELQVPYRQNHVTRFVNAPNSQNGTVFSPGSLDRKTSIMANLYYDFNDFRNLVGLPITPYIGAGVGVTIVDWSITSRSPGAVNFGPLGTASQVSQKFFSTDTVLATQAIVGASYDISSVPGLSINTQLESQFLPQGYTHTGRLTLTGSPPDFPFGVLTSPSSMKYRNQWNNAVTVGLRYAFNAPPATAAPADIAPIAPPAAARTYLVFFDWDRADLTDRARQIIAEAAGNARRSGTTRIEVAGHADRSGTPAYNQALSQRRAENVAVELVRQGIARNEIAVSAFGEIRPLVPTADGVREPQNRRVEIVLK